MHYKGDATLAEWIADDQALADAVSRWQPVIALDTEFIRTNTYYPLPGLYQVASGDEVFLIDPLMIDQWQPFVDYLTDPNTTKIMHACLEDLELIYHHLGISPAGIFDTQYANAFVSADFSLSYAALVERMTGTSLEKHETRSNWLQRPLTDEQIHYAIEDVTYLGSLHSQLSESLADLGRADWFDADMQGRGTYVPTDPQQYFRNIKKAWQLPGPKLAVLQALCAWRELTARKEDVPRNRVIWDDHLFSFAEIENLSEDHVHSASPRGVAKRYAADLIEQHRSGLQSEAPQALPKPLSSAQGATVKMLREVALSKANHLGMAPELLARKKDLEACVRHHVSSSALSPHYTACRGELVAVPFIEVLQARSGG